jgi:hypothetical protein
VRKLWALLMLAGCAPGGGRDDGGASASSGAMDTGPAADDGAGAPGRRCRDEDCHDPTPWCATVGIGDTFCNPCREDAHCPADHPHCLVSTYSTYCGACRFDAECPAGTHCTSDPDCIDDCRLDCRAPPPPPDPCRREGREAGECDEECAGSADVRAIVPVADGDGLAWNLAWNGAEIGVAAVDSDGDARVLAFVRLDGRGRRLGGAEVARGRAFESPVVAWTGAGWLVAWSDRRFDVQGGVRNTEVYARALGPDGAPVGEEVRLTDAPGFSAPVDAAWSGEALGLLVADDRDATPDRFQRGAYLLRLGPDGAPRGDAVRLDRGGETQPAALVWAGDHFAAVWHQGVPPGYWPLYVARAGADGVPRGAPVRLTDERAEAADATLAARGGGLVVAWREQSSDGVSSIRLRRVPADGPPGPVVEVAGPETTDGPPDVAWSGDDVLVAWSSVKRLYANRIAPDGTRPGPDVWFDAPGDVVQTTFRRALFDGDRVIALDRVAVGDRERLGLVAGPLGCR